MFRKQTAGIEIREDGVRAVLYRAYSPGAAPDHTWDLPLAPAEEQEWDSALCRALEELAGQMVPRPVRVAVAVPSHWCLFRTLRFPYGSPARVEATYRYTMEERLPGPVEHYATAPMSEVRPVGEEGSRLTVVACPKEKINTVVEALREAGLRFVTLQPALTATAGAAPGQDDLPRWLLRRDGTAWEVVLQDEDGIRGCCLVPGGPAPDGGDSEGLCRRISTALRAEELEVGGVEEARLRLVACPALASEHKRLAEYTGMPVALNGPEGENERWLVARHMAALAAGCEAPVADLSEEQFQARAAPGSPERRLTVALALLVAALVVTIAYTGRLMLRERDLLQQARQRRRSLVEQVAGAGATLYELEAQVAQMRRAHAAAERTRQLSCLERWTALMALVPEDVEATFELLDFNQSRARVRALVPLPEQATRLRTALQQGPRFVPASTSSMSRTQDGMTRLEMELSYR